MEIFLLKRILIYSGFQKVRRFMSAKHPSVEIISINPVGLKGLFNDIYT